MIKAMCGFGVQTQKHLEDAASIYTEGCSDSAVIWTESHLLLVGTLALGLALPQVVNTINPGTDDTYTPLVVQFL